MATSYIKLKFDRILTAYQRLIVVKLYCYVNSFAVNAAGLKDLFKEFDIPNPTNYSFEKIIVLANAHPYLKIQDESGQYPCIARDTIKDCMPSLLLNSYNKSLDQMIVELRKYLKSGDLDDQGCVLVNKLQMQLILYNVWIPKFLFNYACSQGHEIDFHQFCRYYPSPDFFRDGKSMVNFFRTMYIAHRSKLDEEHDSIDVFLSMYTMFEQFRGYCAFGCLVEILFDSIYTSVAYHVFTDIAFYLLYHYSGSVLYRIEKSVSPVSTHKHYDERGSKDHTTQLKIYLFDGQGKPVLIRIDLPHKGVPYMHYNIISIDGAVADDHKKIECNLKDESAIFDSLQEQLLMECSNLVVWQDSSDDDDRKVLNDMQIFSLLNELSIDYYLTDKDNSEHLRQFSEMMNKEYTSISDAMEDGYFYLTNL